MGTLQLNQYLDDIVHEIKRKQLYQLQETQAGIRSEKDETRIILYGKDKQDVDVFIKFPFPTEPTTNKRQAKRVYELQGDTIKENKELFRFIGLKPIKIAGLFGVVSELGTTNLEDYLLHITNQEQRANITFEAIKQSTRGMEKLHDKGLLVCDYKDTNVVLFPDQPTPQWMIIDPESFKQKNEANVHDEQFKLKKYFSSTNRITEAFEDWNIDKNDYQLTESTDWFSVGATLFKAYFGETPLILKLEEKKTNTPLVAYINEKLKEVKNPVHKYFMQRTMGEVLVNNVLPARRSYREFRFNNSKEPREVLEKGKIIYFGKDLEQPEYQNFLKAAEKFKRTINKINKNSTDSEGILDVQAVEQFRNMYQFVVLSYNNEKIKDIPQREEEFQKVESIKDLVVGEQSGKMKEQLQQIKNLSNKEIAQPLWETFSKAMILGLNKEQKMYLLADIENPKENYVRFIKEFCEYLKKSR